MLQPQHRVRKVQLAIVVGVGAVLTRQRGVAEEEESQRRQSVGDVDEPIAVGILYKRFKTLGIRPKELK